MLLPNNFVAILCFIYIHTHINNLQLAAEDQNSLGMTQERGGRPRLPFEEATVPVEFSGSCKKADRYLLLYKQCHSVSLLEKRKMHPKAKNKSFD